MIGRTNVGGGGSVSLDLKYGAILPATVVNNQVFAITSVAPTTWFIDTVQPTTASAGDIWLKSGESGVRLSITDAFFVNIVSAYQLISGTWTSISAYVGVSGSWESLMPSIGTPLENFTWMQINKIGEDGLQDTYFEIGDTKTVSIDGETAAMVLVGMNHDTLVTQIGTRTNAAYSFVMRNCLSVTRQINSTKTNVGGWNSSTLRAWCNGDCLDSLADDLKAVIKPVVKYTSAGSRSTSIVTANDSVFLPSIKEIGLTYQNAAATEGTTYAWFAANTKVKSVNDDAANWRTRSPSTDNSTTFCCVSNTGVAYNGTSDIGTGVAVGFCV